MSDNVEVLVNKVRDMSSSDISKGEIYEENSRQVFITLVMVNDPLQHLFVLGRATRRPAEVFLASIRAPSSLKKLLKTSSLRRHSTIPV